MLAELPTAVEPTRQDVNDVRAPLRDVLDALCEGMKRAERAGSDTETARFVTLAKDAEKSMCTHIPPEMQRVSFLGASFREKALSAARGGDLVTADDDMRRARASMAAFTNPDVTRFADTLTEAAAAYVDYKAGRFAAARAGIEASLDATNRLLVDHRCDAMHLRRVHLVANLVRVGARSGDGTGAMQIAAGLLSYLEGGDASWPMRGFEVDWPIDTIPLKDRVTMSCQIGGEIALVLATPKSDTASLLMHLAPHAAGPATGACAPFHSLHQWLRLRWAHCNEGPREFLSTARDFFAAQQPGGSWSDGARLLDRFCATLDLDEAARVRQTLKMAIVAKTTDLSSIRI